MHLKPPKRLDNVSDATLKKVQDWLMIEDEELRSACLDFFMQYTSFSDNVDNLLQALDADQDGPIIVYKSLFEEDREYNQGEC